MKALAQVPILVVVGDYLGSDPSAACGKEMDQIKAAGGDITFVSLPAAGIKGSTHMFMQGKENIKWRISSSSGSTSMSNARTRS